MTDFKLAAHKDIPTIDAELNASQSEGLLRRRLKHRRSESRHRTYPTLEDLNQAGVLTAFSENALFCPIYLSNLNDL